jgi:PAS domain S-box-containing protein
MAHRRNDDSGWLRAPADAGGASPMHTAVPDHELGAGVGPNAIGPNDLAFVDAAPTPILITEPNLSAPGPRIQHVNAAFERLTGWPRAWIVGRTPRVFQGPETDPAVLDDLKATLAAGEPWSGATTNYTFDGTPFVVSWSVAPVHNAAGTLVAYMSMQTDMTAEREREHERQRLNQLVARFVDAAPDGVILTNGDQTIVEINAGAARIFGSDRGRLIGEALESLMPPRERVAHRAEIASFARSGRRSQWMRESGEVTGLRGDGTEFPMRASLVKVDDTGSEGFAVFLRDLSPWKAQQAELRENDRCLRQAQRIAGLGHWYWHVESNRFTWSDELYRILGHEPHATQPTQAAFLAHVHADDRDRVRAALEAALAGVRGFDLTHRDVRPDGAIRTVRGQAEIDHTRHGAPRAVMGVLHDVTEVHAAKAALETAYREVEIANSAKSRFLAMLGHELRTPLNAITGFADLMANETHGPLGAPDYVAHARHILENGRHLRDLIESMLDVTRVESQRIQLDETRADAAALTRAAVAHARHETTRGDVEIDDAAVSAVDVIVDAHLVRQAILNLVRNAVKFSPAGGRVTVRGERSDDGGYRIDIRDDGPGIPDAEVADVTLPFIQGEAVLTRAHEGLGIGLYLARSFLELHDGTLHLARREAGGTLATARLPRRRIAADAVAPDRSLKR